MSGLMISLRPNEKFLVNGALLSNGPKRGQICVEGENINILRLCDAIHPDDVNFPVSRLYYSVQTVLSGDSSFEDADKTVRENFAALIHVFEKTPLAPTLTVALKAWNSGRLYSALCRLKPLLSVEANMLTDVSSSAVLEAAE